MFYIWRGSAANERGGTAISSPKSSKGSHYPPPQGRDRQKCSDACGSVVLEHDGAITHYDFTGYEKILEEIHGEKWRTYRSIWNETNEQLITASKPLYVTLCTNSYCNLNCKMCAQSVSAIGAKKKINIPMNIVDKFTSECKELGIPSINVGSSAECTIHPNIREILKKVCDTGAIDKFLFTNGTRLDDDFCEFILNCQIERVYISLDAATPETYRSIRGYDLSKVEKNIEELIKAKKNHHSQLPIIRVSFVEQAENIHEKERFIEKWRDKVDIIDFQKMVNYKNLYHLEDCGDITYRCAAPFNSLSVNYNGDIFPCCSDYMIHLKLGNLSDMSLYEAWTCEKIQNLRQAILDGNLPKPCRNCACLFGKGNSE